MYLPRLEGLQSAKEGHFKTEGPTNAEELSLNAYIIMEGMIESEKGRQHLNCPKFSTQFGTVNDVTFFETVGSFKKYI